jgi:hypothetical protein
MSSIWVDLIDLSPFEWNFDLDKSGQKFHRSLKEHHKISNIPKFRCEMLLNADNIALRILPFFSHFVLRRHLRGGNWQPNRVLGHQQGRRNDVKARGTDFRERALLNWYILRDVCKTSGVELRLIMFSIYWMIGVWGGSPPGNCAILEARWLHFVRFLKQIRKRIALTFLTIRYFAKAIL